MIKIDLKVFNEVLKFADKYADGRNEILKCVHIFDREDKRIYEATNGHYLARVATDKQDEESINICVFPKEKMKGGFAYLNDDGTIRTDSGLYYVETYDGADYRDTDRIFKEMEGAEPAKFYVSFNPDYLKRVADLFGRDWYAIQPPLQQDYSAWGGNPAYNPCFWKTDDKMVALMPIRI